MPRPQFVLLIVFATTTALFAEPPKVELSLKAVEAKRRDGDVKITCIAVIDNRTEDELTVMSNFFSAFDFLTVVVRDKDGKELHRQGYTAHFSPYTSKGREFKLAKGENKKVLGFPIAKIPNDVDTIRVSLIGIPRGGDLKGEELLLVSDVLETKIEAEKK